MVPGRQFGKKPAPSSPRCFTAACLALIPLISQAAGLGAAESSWSWSQPETKLQVPKFSPDGQSLVVQSRFFVVTGAFLSEKVFDKRYAKHFKRDPRFADPTITLVRIADGTRQTLGYGFDPVFSPDGTRVAFEQLNATPKFYFFGNINKPRTSNGLAIYDLVARELRRVAEPTTGHCMRPIFTPDGKSLIFGVPLPDSFVVDAFPVSLVRLDLASGTLTTLYAHQNALGMAHLLREYAFVGERLLVRRSIAASYQRPFDYFVQLIDPVTGEVAYDWGEQELTLGSLKRFARWRDGTVAVFAGSWASVASAPKSQQRAVPGESPGVLSPNGHLVARADDLTVIVEELATGRRLATFEATPGTSGAYFDDLAWSADSKRLAWIDVGVGDPPGQEESLGHDVLRVVVVPNLESQNPLDKPGDKASP